MQQNSNSNSDNRVRNSVSEFVKMIVDSYKPVLRQRAIAIETDLERVQTTFNGEVVDSVTRSLIENAMNKMPNGGVISLTLIDGNHQWELEVADSDGMAFNSFNDAGILSEKSDGKPNQLGLPTILPTEETESLRTAQQAASSLGGQIQVWDCPQGGTAHVFVAPKPKSFRSLAK